jgi:hypothetical protein
MAERIQLKKSLVVVLKGLEVKKNRLVVNRRSYINFEFEE